MAKMKPWTYSHLDSFESCPKRFYHTKVAYDVKEAESEQIKWGNTVHKAFENYVALGKEFPETMKAFEPIGAQIRNLPGEKQCELKLSINRAFQPVEWSSKEAWSRGIADLLIKTPSKVMIIDYKTGKRKPSEQIALYALYAFSHYPSISEVQSGFIWLKDRKIDKEVFKREDVADLWKPFLARAHKLENAYAEEKWPPRPSGLCKGWCPCKDCKFFEEKKK